ncbi:hypothetical protein [Agromyces neolithicus]|uniref:Uncharacterized protein n=1 Tax=Agromyces neolithicus TaxID=269420 RepID=A0ABN2LSP2_9MICO
MTRRAGRRLVEELEGEAELTALANSVIERVGQPSAGSPFLHESERTVREGTDW